MIIFMTDNQVRRNFKKAGYTHVGDDVVELINKIALQFVKNIIEKSMKKNKGFKVLDVEQLTQTGGRVLMPSEYYGVRTNRYIADAPMGTDMTVSSERIRPSFTADLSGGAKDELSFNCSLQTIKNVGAEILSSKNIKLTQAAYKQIHTLFNAKMTDFLKSVKRTVKGDTLTKKDLTVVLSLKKFSSLKADKAT